MKWLLIPTLALLFAAAAAAGTIEVRVIDTEITQHHDPLVVARGELSVEGLPHRRLHVYFQVRLGAETALSVDGKDLLIQWGELFTPRDTVPPVVWSDLRLGIPFEKIQKATNLPRGKRSVLFVVCDVWDPQTGEYLTNGWSARSPFIVDVDAEGGFTSFETFNTESLDTAPLAFAKKPGKAATLELKQLKLKKGTRVVRTVGLKHEVHDWLHREETVRGEDVPGYTREYVTDLEALNRGGFFEPITTAAQAKELVALAHQGAVVIPGREDFDRILADIEDRGFSPGTVKFTGPPSYGLTAVEEPGVGWRVRGVLFETDGRNRKQTGLVLWVDYAVTPEGKLGRQVVECIDTSVQHLLGVPGAKLWPRLPNVVKVTDEVTSVPEYVQEVGEYLDPADWPAPEDR